MGASGAASRTLTAYSGRSADLFDDGIDPAAVGLDFDKNYTPKSDPMLRERAQTSDAVVRAKISTVTAKKDGLDPVFQISLRTLEKVTGQKALPANFTFFVHKSSDSHGIVKSLESRLVGQSFVAFVREFVRPDGESELHVHLSPDTKDVKSAVSDAVVLGEAYGR